MGRNKSWARGKQHARQLLKALLFLDQNGTECSCNYKSTKLRWDNKQSRLWVTSTLQELSSLVKNCGGDATAEDVRNVLLCAKDLGIIEDTREKTSSRVHSGSKILQFVFNLKSWEGQENLHWLFGYADGKEGHWDYLYGELKAGRLVTPFPQPLALKNNTFDLNGETEFLELDDSTRWVGREALVTSLVEKLNANCRILSLVGITGIGKTALSSRLMQDVQTQFQACYVVDFNAEVPNFQQIIQAVLGPKPASDGDGSHQQVEAIAYHLQHHRCLLILDMMEVWLRVTEDGRFQFRDVAFQQLFHRIATAATMNSRIIITSQDQLPVVAEGRYDQFTHTELLKGLSLKESIKLFQIWDIPIKEPKERKLLSRIIEVYEGHPLALRVIAGELRADPYCGNIQAYWSEYGAEIKKVERLKTTTDGNGKSDRPRLDRYSSTLVERVKCRIERVFDRLCQDDHQAYLMLCYGSVYREETTRKAWLMMMFKSEEEEQQIRAFQSLQRRYLLESKIKHHEVFYRLHSLMRRVALDHLEKLEEKLGPSGEPLS